MAIVLLFFLLQPWTVHQCVLCGNVPGIYDSALLPAPKPFFFKALSFSLSISHFGNSLSPPFCLPPPCFVQSQSDYRHRPLAQHYTTMPEGLLGQPVAIYTVRRSVQMSRRPARRQWLWLRVSEEHSTLQVRNAGGKKKEHTYDSMPNQ